MSNSGWTWGGLARTAAIGMGTGIAVGVVVGATIMTGGALLIVAAPSVAPALAGGMAGMSAMAVAGTAASVGAAAGGAGGAVGGIATAVQHTRAGNADLTANEAAAAGAAGGAIGGMVVALPVLLAGARGRGPLYNQMRQRQADQQQEGEKPVPQVEGADNSTPDLAAVELKKAEDTALLRRSLDTHTEPEMQTSQSSSAESKTGPTEPAAHTSSSEIAADASRGQRSRRRTRLDDNQTAEQQSAVGSLLTSITSAGDVRALASQVMNPPQRLGLAAVPSSPMEVPLRKLLHRQFESECEDISAWLRQEVQRRTNSGRKKLPVAEAQRLQREYDQRSEAALSKFRTSVQGIKAHAANVERVYGLMLESLKMLPQIACIAGQPLGCSISAIVEVGNVLVAALQSHRIGEREAGLPLFFELSELLLGRLLERRFGRPAAMGAELVKQRILVVVDLLKN